MILILFSYGLTILHIESVILLLLIFDNKVTLPILNLTELPHQSYILLMLSSLLLVFEPII